MTARPRTTMTLEIEADLHEFLTLMVSDAGPYQSVSAYVEDLIRVIPPESKGLHE